MRPDRRLFLDSLHGASQDTTFSGFALGAEEAPVAAGGQVVALGMHLESCPPLRYFSEWSFEF